MSKWVPRLAMSGFVCCILLFTADGTILISSRSDVFTTVHTSVYAHGYNAWMRSLFGRSLFITKEILLQAIWIHILIFLWKFKELLVISIAIIANILWSVYNEIFYQKFVLFSINMIVTIVEGLTLLISLWFIKHSYIRGFVRWYTIAVLAGAIALPFLVLLRHEFGIRWLLINPLIPTLLPYSVLTVMFLNIWVRSRNYTPPLQ